MSVKKEDPRSFLIPFSFETGITYNALADLGVAISMMPLLMCTKIGMGLLSCTNVVVQVADGSSKRPLEIAENVLLLFTGVNWERTDICLKKRMPRELRKEPKIKSTQGLKIGKFKFPTDFMVLNMP